MPCTIQHFLSVAYVILLIRLTRCFYGTRKVTTTFGVLRGDSVNPGIDELPPVSQFLGVPYGVAPLGLYRFNMAISAAKWTHLPKNASNLSPVCMQSGIPEIAEAKALIATSAQRYDHLHRLLMKLRPQSEDCLYMNLFVPERIESKNNRLPVLVIVHGDEYGWNSGNHYNGTTLASFGQIIVVTLNYRLGVFGFLGRCESDSCSGNAGLSDIVAALKMLSNTLPAFGGDPSLITILGWGSGASLVSLLMASPITQPNNRLFRRAILLDGSALAPWAINKNPQPIFLQLAEHLKCFDPVANSRRSIKERKSVDQVLRCVQEQSAENVTFASRKILQPTFLSVFAPIIDGQVIPNKPEILFGAQFGTLFRNIDLLVGMSSNPAHYLIPNDDLKNGVDKEKRLKIFRTLVRNLYEYHRKEILAAMINEYTDWDNPKEHPKAMRNGVLSALSDVLFTVPTIETARYHSLDETKHISNTFMFVFAHETKHLMNEVPNSGIRGSLSGDHIPYILGYPLNTGKNAADLLYYGFNPEDREISRVMMHYVSNFVKSGDPSKPIPLSTETKVAERFYSTAWPQFNQATREAYLEITNRPLVKNYYRNAQVGFWYGFIPQLHSTGKNDLLIPEEHNFLPNHFKKETFFGVVRPYASYANDPFPPPPPPPTPIPESLQKLTTSISPSPTESQIVQTSQTPVLAAQNSTILSVTVAVGCGLLFLNICIGYGLYRQCNKRDKSKKKMQLQFQTYAMNREPVSDINYNLNNTLNHQLLAAIPTPSLPPLSHNPSNFNSPVGCGLPQNSQIADVDQYKNPYKNYSIAHTNVNTLNRSSIQEQEPLLSSNKALIGSLRPGISPTCPKHGRAAIAIARGRVNSVGSIGMPNVGLTLEEIQV